MTLPTTFITAFFASLALLAGCATGGTSATTLTEDGREALVAADAALRAANSSAADLGLIDFRRIRFGDQIETRVDSRDPARDFAFGKAFFEGYALPDRPEPYTLEVAAPLPRVARASTNPAAGTAAAPLLLFLDANGEPVRVVSRDDRDAVFLAQGFDPLNGLSTRVDPAREKYLLLVADPRAAGSFLTFIEGGGFIRDRGRGVRYPLPVAEIRVPVSFEGDFLLALASNPGTLDTGAPDITAAEPYVATPGR